MIIKFKRTHPDARTPKYQTLGAAAFDIQVVDDYQISAKKITLCKTGLVFELPPNTVGKLYIRSSVAKRGIALANGCGIIDCDFRGELRIPLTLWESHVYAKISSGDRIAQMIVEPIHPATLEEVQHVNQSHRDKNGFGSTGR